jgi:hypothetical protein
VAVRGDDPLKIKQRCGHRTFSTTELYVRDAEAVREGFGDPFPALPAALLGIAPNRPERFSRSRSSQRQAVLGGVDGTRTRDRNADESLVNKLFRGNEGKVESSRLETVRDHSRPVETVHGRNPRRRTLSSNEGSSTQ